MGVLGTAVARIKRVSLQTKALGHIRSASGFAPRWSTALQISYIHLHPLSNYSGGVSGLLACGH